MGTSAAAANAPAALSLCAAAGCTIPGGKCDRDSDCVGGEVCARTGDCAPEGSLLTIRVGWTVFGVQPTPADPSACDGIDHLIVALVDDDTGEQFGYEPVPCT